MKRSSYFDHHSDSRDPYQSSESEDNHQPTYRGGNRMSVSKPHQKRVRQHNGYNDYRYERYESYPPSLLDREQNTKAIRVKFFKNRDALYKGIVLSISEKMFPSLDSLMNHLNSKIDTPQGVMYIFRLEDGKLIESVKDFQPGDECVVSSTLKIDRNVQYGQVSGPPSPIKRGAPLQRSQGPSREHILRGSNSQTRVGPNRSPNQAKSKPLTFTVINNTMRTVQDKMIINPQTEQSFEQMLLDMGEVVSMSDNPATAMYCAVPPYNKIESFSNLRHELLVKKVESFFVVGGEGAPKELRQKKVPVREPTPPPEDDMDYYEEPQHQTYREHSPQRQKERGKWKPAKEPPKRQQNVRPIKNGYGEDKNQNSFAVDRAQPRNRGNVSQRGNNNSNRQTAHSQKFSNSREDLTRNSLHERRRSIDSNISKPSRDSREGINRHEQGSLTSRSQRNERQASNKPTGKPQRHQQKHREEERDMEVDEGEEDMQYNGYHDEVDNQDDGRENGTETDHEYDDEPPQQRPARKGPRMETPEC
ncbi:echinoderm microtubule-associated protein-like CG42247 [Saccostrea cucullata]|uniref:echinoderm microtubule-associated protein-like CG42247 n=1 Tax=Saccostrea cuccullata TaxID=36930 RepID=UPI002ED0C6A2